MQLSENLFWFEFSQPKVSFFYLSITQENEKEKRKIGADAFIRPNRTRIPSFVLFCGGT